MPPNRRLHRLQGVAQGMFMVGHGEQVEPANPGFANVRLLHPVAKGEAVAAAEFVIHTRADDDSSLRHAEDAGEGINQLQGLGIERNGMDDGAVVYGCALGSEQEGGTFTQRTTDVAAVLAQQEGGLLLGVGIARVPDAVADIEEGVAAKLVGPRFGEHVNAAKAELVVFGREGILVDSGMVCYRDPRCSPSPGLACRGGRLLQTLASWQRHRERLINAPLGHVREPPARARQATGFRLSLLEGWRIDATIGAFSRQRCDVSGLKRHSFADELGHRRPFRSADHGSCSDTGL